jgi:hypothetical protein
MFILRKITGNGGELNFALGDSYSLTLKDANPKEFKEILSVGGHDAFEDDLYGFITYGDRKHQMLFKKQFNYIMTDTGKTFTNVTHHEKIRARNAESAESEKHFESVQKLHEEIVEKKTETKLSDHFTKSICHVLKSKLDVDTVEQAALYSDDELLKVNGFGRIALRNLRRIRTDLAFKKLGAQSKVTRSIPDEDGGF